MNRKSKVMSRYLLKWLSFFRHVRYRRLTKSRVVIFDSAGSEFIKKLIVKEIDHTILSVRNEALFVFPALAILFLKNFAWIYLFYRKYRGLYLIYLLSCIEYIKPCIVITFIDNNSLFHAISEIYNKAQFYAIQNGVRTKYSIGKPICDNGHGDVRSRVNFFSFGKYEIDLYKKNGFMINRFYPVGSLIGSYYRGHNNTPSLKYDLCLVSQWRRSAMLAEESSAIRKAVVTLDSYLHKFMEKKVISLCIARASQDKEELDYFKKIYGNKVYIIDFNREAFSTYSAMDNSQVVLTFCSSAAYESFGWGKKALFCNFSGDENYDFPIETPCSITDADYEKFERKLDCLLNTDTNDYLRLTRDTLQYVMSYDAYNPTDAKIRKMLIAALS